MPELYQAEWCPSCNEVRARLTELGVDVIIRQVEAEPDDRDTLAERTGQRAIPAMFVPEAAPLLGSDSILEYLQATYATPTDPPSVAAHRDKAERVRIKQLETTRSIA
jgi:glutathione S-transferase